MKGLGIAVLVVLIAVAGWFILQNQGDENVVVETPAPAETPDEAVEDVVEETSEAADAVGDAVETAVEGAVDAAN